MSWRQTKQKMHAAILLLGLTWGTFPHNIWASCNIAFGVAILAEALKLSSSQALEELQWLQTIPSDGETSTNAATLYSGPTSRLQIFVRQP
jgi:hypothetical protein